MISSCTALVSEAGAAGNGGTVVSHELCMRARICEHPRICSSWKEQACDADDVQHMQTLLGGDQGRLLSARQLAAHKGASRPSESTGSDEGALERALNDKQCA